jgi:uncharacterized protein YkwD
MHRITIALLVVPAAVGLAPAQAATPQPAVEPAVERVAPPQSRYQAQAFAATNRHRSTHDRPALRKQDCVQRFAVRQARRMARQERMYHQDLSPILRRCGLSRVGENVAYGYPSGRAVVNQGWMHSAGHRRNILDRRFRLLGLGARQSDDGTWYAAQVFGRR